MKTESPITCSSVELDNLCINTIRFLSVDAVEKAVSIAESVGERWLQSAGNALFWAQNGLKMHADMR